MTDWNNFVIRLTKNMKYFDRDLSWLSFNERVLIEASDASVPLYERIKFIAIYSSNLDEFFRVRVALLENLILLDKQKLNDKIKVSSPVQLLKEVLQKVDNQQQLLGETIRNQILPELLENKVNLYFNSSYSKEHIPAITELFYNQILTFLRPVIIEKDDPQEFFLKNRKLYILAELVKDGREYVGIVNVPSDKMNRFQSLPSLNSIFHYTFIEDIIKCFSSIVFQSYTVTGQSSIKVNRDAELFLDDVYSDDVMAKITESLGNREIGNASRFIYESNLRPDTLEFLKKQLKLSENDCMVGGSYHNLFDFFSLPNPIGKTLENVSLPPLSHKAFEDVGAIFDSISREDILIAFPYQKYEYVLRLFNQAAIDSAVTEIKLTIYRVAEDSRVAEALISAARNGKKVTVLIEAKARFDERNNLKWAKKMQKAGIDVIFSQQNIKVHSKIALIKRKSSNGDMVKYAFLGTGNFNEKTASIYTDYALLTSDKRLTDELDQTLDLIFGKEKTIILKHLLVARVNMLEKFTKLIEHETNCAKEGKEASIMLKLNNIEDRKIIDKLYEAADAGVEIRLLIRGICTLIPRKNITLKRLVDRYLEHNRVYLFHNSGNPKLFVGSADWMGRNLRRRIEVVFPIYSESIKVNILTNIQLQWSDNIKAVRIDEQLNNIRVTIGSPKKIRAQSDYYNYLNTLNN
ncbi:MAG: polyphosphate kinase 1 [Bacteroidetes bacterium]|nr:MAG: polyphosphate kinase 1 [Bacteroidota bacterium]